MANSSFPFGRRARRPTAKADRKDESDTSFWSRRCQTPFSSRPRIRLRPRRRRGAPPIFAFARRRAGRADGRGDDRAAADPRRLRRPEFASQPNQRARIRRFVRRPRPATAGDDSGRGSKRERVVKTGRAAAERGPPALARSKRAISRADAAARHERRSRSWRNRTASSILAKAETGRMSGSTTIRDASRRRRRGRVIRPSPTQPTILLNKLQFRLRHSAQISASIRQICCFLLAVV